MVLRPIRFRELKMNKKRTQPKVIIGWREWIALPDLGIPAVKTKIDTGARTSAIHVFNLEEFEAKGQQMVKFGIHPLRKNKSITYWCEAPVLERKNVKNSSGRSEKRYVIQTNAQIGDLNWPIKVMLSSISHISISFQE